MIRCLVLIFLLCSVNLALSAEIIPNKNAILQSIDWSATPDMKKRFKPYFEEIVKKPWDILELKIKIDKISKELFNNGYFLSKVKTEIGGTEADVIVKLSIAAKGRTYFHFKGNTLFSYQELYKTLLDKIKNDFGKTERIALESFLNDSYELAGFYNSNVKSYQNEGLDLDGVKVTNYFFDIIEGKKIKVSNVLFRGNLYSSEAELKKLFKKSATTLASAGYYDRTFFENFSEVIKKDYLSKGFVFSEITKPRAFNNDDDITMTVEFGIIEKQQVVLKSISLNRISSEQQAEVEKELINKVGSPLNVIELESDLKKLITHFQLKGYYFANITNLNDDSLLVYDKSNTSVELRPNIFLDNQICFNETTVSGNTKTLSEVILREIKMEKGELITPDKLETVKQKLSELGLFSTLRISPIMLNTKDQNLCSETNLNILVKEKDFGLFEVAPGFRTDLGAKLSTGVTYNNFMGMNRSASFKLQANQRFNLDGFDDRRKTANKRKLEYLGKVSFIEPYLFNKILKTQVELEAASSFQRKRFYGFDADIFRISPQLSKSINKNFSVSLKYQFERINQFDATITKDNDNFSIGAMTPSITYDKRNDPVNPRKGYFLNLSSEWANQYFGSMKNDDLEVNFLKIISRNKFYYPVGDFTLAFSLAMGFEKNYSQDVVKDSTGAVVLNSNNIPRTRGYIPSIKVFRLDGYDEIRGYDETEINRLRTGQAVGDVVVQNEAYFTAFKFEPRYNITDTMQIGLFFDAGRVFINEFKPFDLRTSVGSGLKFLTPVGSLDFDYGIKLQRKTYPDNSRDAVGRFHLSIGFF